MNDFRIRKDGLTLEIERLMQAPRRAVWRCWTEPELLKQWFCPKPWQVAEADLDPRPGGRMYTVMQGPDGERFENEGIWLQVDNGRELAFTDAFTEGFVPRENGFMTGYVRLSDTPEGGTCMVWGARHANEADRQRHLEMGFEEGWKAASAQLAELAVSVAGDAAGLNSANALKAKARTCLFLDDKAEEAARFYVSVMPDSGIDAVYRPDGVGAPVVVEFTLCGAPYMTMNGNPEPDSSHFASISVLTEDQPETDRLWQALLGDGGEEGRCGWLKDRFGVHWQIVPKALPRLVHGGDAAAAGRVMSALMRMNRIDIAGLEAAARGG